MRSEIASKAQFSEIRYGQCWEDADVLLEALDVQPGDQCLSIASAGDNTLALLSKAPARVVALDSNPAQLATLALRVAAYRTLTHNELLELMGSRASDRRHELYQHCRTVLSADERSFWDAHAGAIDAGIGSAGKFERYFTLFRTRVLPWVHSQRRIAGMLARKSRDERCIFYDEQWDTWRWRLLFRVFFSRAVMGRVGRDPSFFNYVEGSVAERILARAHYALTELDTAENPYLQWILTGSHTTALPYALRPENFDSIRANLDKLEWHCRPLEEYLDSVGTGVIDRYNLSDIFEYMSPSNYQQFLSRLALAGRPGGRLVYWNMLVERRRPESMSQLLRPLDSLARDLHATDKAFFYSALVVEEIMAC